MGMRAPDVDAQLRDACLNCDSFEFVQDLIRRGGNVSAPDKDGWNALHNIGQIVGSELAGEMWVKRSLFYSTAIENQLRSNHAAVAKRSERAIAKRSNCDCEAIAQRLRYDCDPIK
jgi:hypothetical protein